jgi:hypothetical protein
MALADLYDRIVGNPILRDSDDPQDTKIALHRFWGMLTEWGNGYETQANVIAMFDLAAGIQLQQGAALKAHFIAAPDKVAFIRVCKDWSYIGENNRAPEADKYRDAAQFLARLATEVTAQGGIAP